MAFEMELFLRAFVSDNVLVLGMKIVYLLLSQDSRLINRCPTVASPSTEACITVAKLKSTAGILQERQTKKYSSVTKRKRRTFTFSTEC